MIGGAADPVNVLLDELVGQVQDHYSAFILARTAHVLGSGVVDAFADDALVTATVGLNVAIEPIPVAELRKFKAVYPDFVIEVFHGGLVQHWQDLLGKIFSHYVELHVKGQRPFVELGTAQVKLDFSEESPLVDQVRESLCRDFDFRKYLDRQKLIMKVRQGRGAARADADVILRHVHFRNAIQHHRGVLREFVFKELGCDSITVLDESGATRLLHAGDKVAISVPELDAFRRALLVIAQQWKTL
jgi:hypothetical protein